MVALRQEDIDYFRLGETENPKFWSRFNYPPMEGKQLLDVGCGHGSLCISAAQAGAARVVGIDIDTERIEFAQAYLAQTFPELQDRVEFRAIALEEYPLEQFDYIVSKDSFEHILNLEATIAEMSQRLVPGGRIFSGFGPLYNSPYGGHARIHRHIFNLPWVQVILPDLVLVKLVNRGREPDRQVNSVYELGLNKLALRDYQRIMHDSGLNVVMLTVNHSTNTVSRLFSLLRQIPFLEEYFSHNIYCILEKPLTEEARQAA